MRSLTLFIATSLDGYIAGPDGAIDWLFHDQDYGYAGFFATIDTVVMGWRTFEVSKGFESDPFPGKKIVVFTRQARPPEPRVDYVSNDPATFTSALKNRPGAGIWLVGGAQIVAELVRANLIDSYRIFIHPILIGNGTRLFADGLRQDRLRCVDVRRFSSGLVEVVYECMVP